MNLVLKLHMRECVVARPQAPTLWNANIEVERGLGGCGELVIRDAHDCAREGSNDV